VIRGAPLLPLVNWADDGTLVGAVPDGKIYVSTDEGHAGSGEGRSKQRQRRSRR
jgi:hypothetical protein